MVKLLWFDGDGLCLLQKRLERGRFVWPQTLEWDPTEPGVIADLKAAR